MKTVIYGAGASMPFFNPQLSTANITRQVLDGSNWNYVAGKISAHLQDKGTSFDYPSVDYILTAAYTKLQQGGQTPQFEQLAEILDKICSYFFDPVRDHNMMNLMLEAGNTQIRLPEGPMDYNTALYAPFLFREIIANYILYLMDNHKVAHYNLMCNQANHFLGTLCNDDEEVNIMTLNYDDILFDCIGGLGFDTGFVSTGAPYHKQLDIHRFMNARRVIYFPHGQIRFQFTDNPGGVILWDSAQQAEEKRWEGIYNNGAGSTITVQHGKFAYNYNTFITTGQTKDDAMNSLPYAAYYQRLARDLRDSDRVYLIGYSFDDAHINRLLKSFLSMHHTNKMIVVDYYTQPVTLKLDTTPEGTTLRKIFNEFNPQWLFVMNTISGQVSTRFPKEVENFASHGYGYAFPQVLYYTRGYADFLNDFPAVMAYI